MNRTWEESAYYVVAGSSSNSSTAAASSSQVPHSVAETPVKTLAQETKAGNSKADDCEEANMAKKAVKKVS